MKKIEIQKTLALIFSFLAVEIWSYLAYSLEIFALPIFLFFSTLFLAVTIYNLRFGLYVIIAELIISSMGHLFFIEIFSTHFSIRSSFWFILMAVFVVKFIIQYIKNRKESIYLKRIKSFKAWKYFILLAVFILIGLAIALINDRSLISIFSDFNAWLFFLTIFPILAVYNDNDKEFKSELRVLFLASGLWLAIKTLFILFVFSQELSISPEIYTWLRNTLVAEVTPTLAGWPRVFLQSHIFAGVFYFFFFWLNNKLRISLNIFKNFFSLKNISQLLLSSLFFSLIIISFSRSFWLSFTLTLFISLIIIWKKFGFKKALHSALWSLISIILSFVIILLVVSYPYFDFDKSRANKFRESFSSRVVYDSDEAATVSRWSLLPVLFDEIKERPLFGQGFAATATYISSDPRVLENNPEGKYTTSAFEWGYLDIWLKIGIFGLLSYFILISAVLREVFVKNKNIYFAFGAILFFVAITHAFTPYLNHPLGISILLLSTCFIYKNRI
ncbi:MAG: O-antigen ligase family protein [Patescibacteria group bacterium]|nr:O-antigen ligase family protein [Patescibacteria group bacterium]